jgi:hypothetical protein
VASPDQCFRSPRFHCSAPVDPGVCALRGSTHRALTYTGPDQEVCRASQASTTSFSRPRRCARCALVALGGSAVAKLIITGSSVKNGSLTGVDIKKGSLTGNNIKKGYLTGNNIKKGSLTGNNIKNNSLGGAQINEGSLSKVPSAGNADTVGGKGAGSFQAADHWALIAGTAAGANILAQSGGLSVTRSAIGRYVVGVGGSASSKPLSVTLNGTIGFVRAEWPDPLSSVRPL